MAGTKVTADVITDGSITAAKLAPGVGSTSWQSTPKTSSFTAVSGEGYFIDTTSSAVTVTLPSSPSVGDSIILVDSSGTSGTNGITLASPNKIQGTDDDQLLKSAKISAELVYSGSSKGWVVSASANEGTTKTALDVPIEIDLLVVAGGGGGGRAWYNVGGSVNLSGGAGGAGEFLSVTGQEIELSSNYTVTVGAGGGVGSNGSNSRLLTSAGQSAAFDYSCNGGGYGARRATSANSGGSGGGGCDGQTAAGSSVKNEEAFGSLGNSGGTGYRSGSNAGGGGGGGAGATGSDGGTNGYSGNSGGDGGDGFASSITGSSVTYAGGGGGGYYYGSSGTGGSGGSGGGGAANVSGTANTGGGGGGGVGSSGGGGAGGSGVVIIKYPNTLNITVGGNLTSSTDTSSVPGFKITTFTAGEDTISWAAA